MPVIAYNRNAAVSYALKWALRRNPSYYSYNDIGGDCTNFVSQCVYAGSGVMNYTENFGWYYIDANNKAPAWTGVDFFYNFITTNEGVGPFGEERPLNLLDLGDIIQTGREGEYSHSMILTRIVRTRRGISYYICAHSNDAKNRNLASYNFDNLRGIHILGVRTE